MSAPRAWVVVWDDAGRPRPQLPVRCLDEELLPAVTMPLEKPHRRYPSRRRRRDGAPSDTERE
jgi:hypothetical protein